MSSRLKIELKDVWKSYEKNLSTRSFATSLRQNPSTIARNAPQKSWALRNIDLTINGGQSIGIFGRNGAGKSTLLGILAGTLDETRGTIHRSGRIAPLLQLTAWIDKNLTGRQNVDTFCAIFGLRGVHRRRVIEQAEEFADLGKFFSAPCRTYSSGMVARLAFAAALHAPSDFLIIDEVLAVGDAGFRDKCQRVLKQRVADGNSLIIVSQNPSAVMTLVSRGIILERGEVYFDGAITAASERYVDLMEVTRRRKSDSVKELAAATGDNLKVDLKTLSDHYRIKVVAPGLPAKQSVTLKSELFHHRGVCISQFASQSISDEHGHAEFGIKILRNLVSGSYILNFQTHSENELIQDFPRAFRLDVSNDRDFGGLVDLSMDFDLID